MNESTAIRHFGTVTRNSSGSGMPEVDFFDPFNDEHLKAYVDFLVCGQFPDWFIHLAQRHGKENFYTLSTQMQAKMAMCWVIGLKK